MKLKKILTSLCLIVPLFLVVVYFSVGDTTKNNTITASEKSYEIYLLAFEQGGFDGTYDEWLADISGVDGDQIEIRTTDTEIQWKYVTQDATAWQTLYYLSDLKGEIGQDGSDGVDGERGLSAYDVWLEFNPNKSEDDFFDSLNVYSLWLKIDGNENKTIDDFYESLQGAKGEAGVVDVDVLYEIYEAFGYTGTLEDFEQAYEDGTIGNLKQEYTITFDNGAEETNEEVDVFDGSRIKKPEDLIAATGYEFSGWYYNDQEWLFDFYTVAYDMTLVARFEAITYTVSFDLGANAHYYPGSIEVTIEDTYVLPIPLKTGYTFVKWTLTDEDFDYGNTLSNISEDLELIAVWEEVVEDSVETYTVTYTLAGTPMETIEVEHGSKLTKPTDPTSLQTGYVFDAWYVDGEKWSFIGYTVTSDITLEAYFTEIQYPITYENVYVNENSFANKTYFTVNDTVTLYPASSRDGYTFVEWRFNDENGDVVTSFEGADFTNDVVLYAVWDVESYSVFYYFDGAYVEHSFAYGNPTALPTIFTGKENYTPVSFTNKLTDNEEISELSLDLLVGGSMHIDVVFELTIHTDDVLDLKYIYYGTYNNEFIRWNIVEEDSTYTLIANESYFTINNEDGNYNNAMTDFYDEIFSELDEKMIIDDSYSVISYEQYCDNLSDSDEACIVFMNEGVLSTTNLLGTGTQALSDDVEYVVFLTITITI